MKPLILVSPQTVHQVTEQYGNDAALVAAALECLAARFRKRGQPLSSPQAVRDSGQAEPSRSDEAMTQALKQALALVDVKVLDHFVVGGGAAMSFAERGLL